MVSFCPVLVDCAVNADCSVTPILGAIVADQYLGKYKAIVLFSLIYMAGLLIMVCTSIPTSLENGAGLGGFIAAILIIGIGTGGIKSNVAPLVGHPECLNKKRH